MNLIIPQFFIYWSYGKHFQLVTFSIQFISIIILGILWVYMYKLSTRNDALVPCNATKTKPLWNFKMLFIHNKNRWQSETWNSDKYDANSNYNNLIFNRFTFCQYYKFSPLVHILNTFSIIFFHQHLSFLTYCNFHLFYWVNLVTTTTNPYFYIAPKVFNKVKIWW